MCRGQAGRGRASQTFELGEPGVAEGTTPYSPPESRRGPRQGDQAVKTKPLMRSCLRIQDQSLGPNASPLFEEQAARTVRYDRRTCSRVDWTSLPLTSHTAYFTAKTHSGRSHSMLESRASRFGIFVSHPIAVSLNDDRLSVMHQPVDQGRCQSVVHIKQGAPFPEGSIRGKHDRSGFITGRNHLEQQIGPALVDRQIAQLIEEEK